MRNSIRFALALLLGGSLILGPTASSRADLVTNGGFETGTLAGWSQSGNTGFTGVTSSPLFVHSGAFGAFAGPVGSTGSISQNIFTSPGLPYTISFWLFNPGGLPNSFSATFDGVTLLSLTNAAAFPFTQFTFSAIANASSTPLTFTFRQDPSFWGLDDVSVATAVPEPASLLAWTAGGIALLLGRRLRRRASGSATC